MMLLRLVMGSSPHTRGAPVNRQDRYDITGIIPAYAGSTRHRVRPRVHHRDHPRIRGEHCFASLTLLLLEGSSPHTRGALRPDEPKVPQRGIIPAYAGSTTCTDTRHNCPRDHPRIRGEHPRSTLLRLRWSGSSPHTRGARGKRLGIVERLGIIPAYAGSTRTS